MAERYTEKDAVECAQDLAVVLGKDFGKKLSDCYTEKGPKVGCWLLSYNPIYGGAVIEDIISEGGARDRPFGDTRRSPREFCDAVRFAITAVDLDRRKDRRV